MPGMDEPKTRAKYLDDAQDLVFACDRNGIITYANKAAGAGLGVPVRMLIGKDLLDGVEELSRSLAANLFQQSILSEGWHGEILLQRADKSVFSAYVSASPIKDKSGELEHVLVIAHDISERKRLEEEIRKRAELATSVIRSAPVGIFTIDSQRMIRAVNRAFARMMGASSQRAYLDHPFATISKDLNPDLIRAVENGLLGIETSIHNRLLTKEGLDDLTVSLIAVPLKDPRGNVESVLVLVENRTELVRVEEQLLQADKLASTGFLAAGIAHEINNPLTGIYTIIDMLAKRVHRDGGNEEPYSRVLANIDRIKDIIRRLLEYANPARIMAQKADLNALIMQVLDFFKFHPVYRQVTVVWDLDKDLPEIVVDPKQIQQIFHNLAMNAAQAMKEKGGRLEISSRVIPPSEKAKSGWVEVRFRDTGPGIPEANMRRIFDPFFTTKPPGEGTGLGLSVSYSIAKNHLGELTARNHPDGGAEFILRLPLTT
jgi:two-component system, NtrC family, sensor kinase